jgi:hypothetical protein
MLHKVKKKWNDIESRYEEKSEFVSLILFQCFYPEGLEIRLQSCRCVNYFVRNCE